MRLAVVKLGNDELVFYNLPVFSKNEELIVFPKEEFLKAYGEIVFNLKCMDNIVKELKEFKTIVRAKRRLEYIEMYLEETRDFMDPLLTFDTQTTLDAFKNHRSKKLKEYKQENKDIELYKDNLQCLIGL